MQYNLSREEITSGERDRWSPISKIHFPVRLTPGLTFPDFNAFLQFIDAPGKYHGLSGAIPNRPVAGEAIYQLILESGENDPSLQRQLIDIALITVAAVLLLPRHFLDNA